MKTTRTFARSASSIAIVGALALGGAACGDDDTGSDADMEQEMEDDDMMEDGEDMMDEGEDMMDDEG